MSKDARGATRLPEDLDESPASRVYAGLSAAQADGLACVICAADYLTVRVPHKPVGRSATGSQVFACSDVCCLEVVRRELAAIYEKAGPLLFWESILHVEVVSGEPDSEMAQMANRQIEKLSGLAEAG
jgi:hypothetical protein